jgi:divalent metal cation (Fe/Co/Zn/Cd) transporter
MTASVQRHPTARAYALLSIGAALITIGLKFWAYRLTHSVGLLSDALESIVNLVAANIVWTGINLLRETGLGLLDTAIPKAMMFVKRSNRRSNRPYPAVT